MNIRFSLIAVPVVLLALQINDLNANAYTSKQKVVLLLNSINDTVWKSTASQQVTDPIFVTQGTINALPGLPATTGLFFSRTPDVVNIQELICPEAFESTILQPFVPYSYSLKLQQHTLGVNIGQLWSHENLEMGWQWWFGSQERNWWLASNMRSPYQETLKNFTTNPLRSTQTNNHTPQEPNHRLTIWHATSNHVGIGDVHLQARYRAYLSNWFSCSLGGYITLPVGTRAHQVTPINSDDTLPLNTDEIGIRIINRVRDIMLCAPFGKNGHMGIGLQSDAQLFLTRQWSIRGSFTQLHYLSGIENRYALTPLTSFQKLEEGIATTMEGISSNEAIASHLKYKLYPSEIKTHLQPGLFRTLSAGIHYENIPFHCALLYGYETTNPEYSESAPLATLQRKEQENHRINALAGWRKCFQWGQSSTYAHGFYTLNGTHYGAWGVGMGVTVQG